MHLGKPLQRRVIVPRAESLTVPEADGGPPATEAGADASAPAPPVTEPSAVERSAAEARPAS